VAIRRVSRDEVLRSSSARDFIRMWQEVGEEIRETPAADPEYRAIRLLRNERSTAAADAKELQIRTRAYSSSKDKFHGENTGF